MKKQNILLLIAFTSIGLILGGCNNSKDAIDTNIDSETKEIVNEEVSDDTVNNQDNDTNEETINENNEEVNEESANEVTTNQTDDDILSSEVNYDFEIIHKTDSASSHGVLKAFDNDNNELWTYETKECDETELDVIGSIGNFQDDYYLYAGGEVICIDNKGNEKWINGDFQGASACFDFDENGTLFIMGYYGSSLITINKEGETVSCLNLFDEDAFWPYDIQVFENVVAVTFESNSTTYFVRPFEEKLLSLKLTDLINETNIISDEEDTANKYSYRIPTFYNENSLDSITKINQTFTDYYNNFIDPELEKNNEGSPINITSVDYSYSIHQNVLSIYLQDETNNDTNQYISGNISLDGESVTNSDLIKIAGFTQDEVIGSITNQLEDLTDEEYKEKTLAEDNCNINLPMWINDDGNLIVVVKIYSSNNAGYYYKDIIIGK